MPQLWGLGIQQSQAGLVALTTGHCVPTPGWVEGILAWGRSEPLYAGRGGPIAGPEGRAARDWAVYFTRYSAFMPQAGQGRAAREIPGDNAVYRRADLERFWLDRQEGFWETLFHERLRQAGRGLYFAPEMQVRLGETAGAGDFWRARFRHGAHYGSTRPGTSWGGRILRIVAAPLLLPFLIARIGGRVVRQRPDWLGKFCWALPWLVIFLGAWSLGELKGYWYPRVPS
ncbi:glycosyltransferase family protein [Anthocerotibacter panamensis]|uniref:hypothetical protein n=1 Tax=Anthocerotibacter panamensis TaxID=2857077 RepID=UPI001C40684D|nr:hypothetical protein [Anthocerotibacter panamensis]